MLCDGAVYRRLGAGNGWSILWMGLVVGACLSMVGCSCNNTIDQVENEDTLVMQLAGSISDAAGDKEALDKLFVTPADVPPEADWDRYRKAQFRVKDNAPDISGDTATMVVIVEDVVTGDALGEQTWTAERVGEEWRLKTAPLP